MGQPGPTTLFMKSVQHQTKLSKNYYTLHACAPCFSYTNSTTVIFWYILNRVTPHTFMEAFTVEDNRQQMVYSYNFFIIWTTFFFLTPYHLYFLSLAWKMVVGTHSNWYAILLSRIYPRPVKKSSNYHAS